MVIGAHLSISGGHDKALDRLVAIGGNALQIFSSSPRGWNYAQLSTEAINEFKKKAKGFRISPIYFHASYLVNLADTGNVGRNSVKSLTNELNLASVMGIKGSIVHLGSFKNYNAKGVYTEPDKEKYRVLIKNIKTVLDVTPQNTYFIIENAGNRKIGLKLDEIGRIIKDLGDNRVRVCLDTCHLHAAGYDLSSKENYDKFLQEFDKKIGLDLLEVWHMNDSHDEFGSNHDHHENLGSGKIDFQVFKNIVNHKKTKNISFIIETPGFDGEGPDKQNIDILKSLQKQ